MGSSSPEKLKETQSEPARTSGLHIRDKLGLGGKKVPLSHNCSKFHLLWNVL